MSDTADVSLAQTIGGTELTVIIRRTPQVPGPLRVDVLAHRLVRALDLQVSLGGEQRNLDVDTPGMHSAVLHVDAPGPHELVLRAGGERALLPFRVLTPRTALWELVAYSGFAVCGLAPAGALLAAARARRGPAVAQGALSVLALAAALTAAGLSSTLRMTVPSGAEFRPDIQSDGPQGRALVRHPRARDSWGLDIVALPEEGRWRFEFAVTGPRWPGTGMLLVPVGPRPGPPAALGWAVGLLPLVAVLPIGGCSVGARQAQRHQERSGDVDMELTGG
ncbi:MAG: hypothetical protein M3R63_22510 [Actinomycetota bacterium]|nr:hypothetical protein [Actinomycetota bacterium]